MPRVDPAEFASLPLEVFDFVEGFPLHDVWQVELDGDGPCTVPDLRRLIAASRRQDLSFTVRALFSIRSLLGRVFRLDSTPSDEPARHVAEHVPQRLRDASVVPPGTREGPFEVLYVLPGEAAHQVLNATVHAIVVVALTPTKSGHRFFWATYVKPVGRITSLYMRAIDPFRRSVVYPGLESWLRRAWRERNG